MNLPAAPRGMLPAAVGADLVEAFLANKSKTTITAYRRDLESFRAFLGADTVDDAAAQLVGNAHGEANGLALGYRADMLERGLSPNTVNRRLAALRSLVKLANVLGKVPWQLDVPNVKGGAYKDTRGPGRDGFRDMLSAARGQKCQAKALRDVAILRLLHDVGLRRGEVVSLDVEHLDLAEGRVAVLGKGRHQREWLTLPVPTRDALVAWLGQRGIAPGALFTNFDRARKGDGRMTGAAVYNVVAGLGRQVGVKTRPHGLRHLAVTTALDATGGDVRAVQRFSRHADLRVLNVYDDNRRDMAGEVAAMVASAV